MHPEGASNCSWGNHRALLRFTCTRKRLYACKSMLASVLLGLARSIKPRASLKRPQTDQNRSNYQPPVQLWLTVMSTTTTVTKTSTNNASSSTPSPRWTHLFAVLAAIALGATLLRPQWTTTAAKATKTGRRGVRGRRPRRGRRGLRARWRTARVRDADHRQARAEELEADAVLWGAHVHAGARGAHDRPPRA